MNGTPLSGPERDQAFAERCLAMDGEVVELVVDDVPDPKLVTELERLMGIPAAQRGRRHVDRLRELTGAPSWGAAASAARAIVELSRADPVTMPAPPPSPIVDDRDPWTSVRSIPSGAPSLGRRK